MYYVTRMFTCHDEFNISLEKLLILESFTGTSSSSDIERAQPQMTEYCGGLIWSATGAKPLNLWLRHCLGLVPVGSIQKQLVTVQWVHLLKVHREILERCFRDLLKSYSRAGLLLCTTCNTYRSALPAQFILGSTFIWLPANTGRYWNSTGWSQQSVRVGRHSQLCVIIWLSMLPLYTQVEAGTCMKYK